MGQEEGEHALAPAAAVIALLSSPTGRRMNCCKLLLADVNLLSVF